MFAENIKSLQSPERCNRWHAPLEQNTFQHLHIHCIVIRYQYQSSPLDSRVIGIATDGFSVGRQESYFEMKFAALAYLAFQPDPSIHQFHQPLGDGQSQSRSAIAAAGGHVRLREGLKYLALLFDWDSNSGIRNGEVEPQSGFRLARQFRQNRYLPSLRELHRISNQVDEYLAQTHLIASHQRRNSDGVPRQINAFFLGLRDDWLKCLLDAVFDRKVAGFQFQFP